MEQKLTSIPESINSLKSRQTGSMLLEALISVLIFSMGILAIIGLQAASVKASSDAKYRTEASFYANELIGKMWVSSRSVAALTASFAGTGGAGGTEYVAWTGNASTLAAGTIMGDLPGAQLNPPSVVVESVPGGHQSSKVTITIHWQLPGESTVHQYITVAQIS